MTQVPHTPLSLARYVTLVHLYREEMHSDFREAFKRFEVDAAFEARWDGDAAPHLERFKAAAFQVERAAFEGRSTASPRLKVSMSDAAGSFFEEIGPTLDVEFSRKLPLESPDGPASLADQVPTFDTMTLLDAVYCLFYVRAFRESFSQPPDGRFRVLPDPDAFAEAWKRVRDGLIARRGIDNALRADVAVLMQALAFEYSAASNPVWTFCW